MKKKQLLFITFFCLCTWLIIYPTSVFAIDKIDTTVTANPGDTDTDIQKLLDLNRTDNYNLTINIPAGTYILNNELHIYSDYYYYCRS